MGFLVQILGVISAFVSALGLIVYMPQDRVAGGLWGIATLLSVAIFALGVIATRIGLVHTELRGVRLPTKPSEPPEASSELALAPSGSWRDRKPNP